MWGRGGGVDNYLSRGGGLFCFMDRWHGHDIRIQKRFYCVSFNGIVEVPW